MNANVMNKPDSVIRQEGMRVLLDTLGKVDAERFISLIIREPFDYAAWQRNLFEEMSLEELCNKAMAHYEAN